MHCSLVAGLLGALLTINCITYVESQANIFGIANQRPSWEALAAMMGFTTNNRRQQLENLISETTNLNDDVEGLIDRILYLLKPVREVDATKSEDRLSLAKKTAERHAIIAQDISDRGDRGVKTMQEVSDFLLNTAEFLHTLTRKSQNTKLTALLNEVQSAYDEMDKLMAVTVTYALKANQAAYDATASAEKVRSSTLLRVAIDNVMDAEAASSQAGEVAQAIMVNEQIAQATGEKYVTFFADALASISTIRTPSSDVRNVLGQLLGTVTPQSFGSPKQQTERVQQYLNTAISRLRTLRTTARIYLEATSNAASETKTLMDMLGSLRESNAELANIPTARANSMEAAQRAAKSAESDYNSITIAVAIAEKVADRATDIISMQSAYETAQMKISDVENLVEKLRQSKDLAEKKKQDIFGSIKTIIPSPSKKSS